MSVRDTLIDAVPVLPRRTVLMLGGAIVVGWLLPPWVRRANAGTGGAHGPARTIGIRTTPLTREELYARHDLAG